MQKDPPQPSFGHYLRAARIEKGIGLEEVAASTCISLEVLRHIEDENMARLPAEVFVTGFLRAYAARVGADGDLAVASYRSRCGPVAEAPCCRPAPDPRQRRFWIRLVLMLSGLVLVVAVWLLFVRLPSTPAVDGGDQCPSPPGVDRPAGPATTGAPPGAADLSKTAAAPSTPGEFHRLEILASEDTWVKMIIDDHPPRQVTLKANERGRFQAHTGFNLLIGNAAGVRLTFNDEAVAVPGRDGQVVTLKLP
jgi:hypothetical protein